LNTPNAIGPPRLCGQAWQPTLVFFFVRLPFQQFIHHLYCFRISLFRPPHAHQPPFPPPTIFVKKHSFNTPVVFTPFYLSLFRAQKQQRIPLPPSDPFLYTPGWMLTFIEKFLEPTPQPWFPAPQFFLPLHGRCDFQRALYLFPPKGDWCAVPRLSAFPPPIPQSVPCHQTEFPRFFPSWPCGSQGGSDLTRGFKSFSPQHRTPSPNSP